LRFGGVNCIIAWHFRNFNIIFKQLFEIAAKNDAVVVEKWKRL